MSSLVFWVGELELKKHKCLKWKSGKVENLHLLFYPFFRKMIHLFWKNYYLCVFINRIINHEWKQSFSEAFRFTRLVIMILFRSAAIACHEEFIEGAAVAEACLVAYFFHGVACCCYKLAGTFQTGIADDGCWRLIGDGL